MSLTVEAPTRAECNELGSPCTAQGAMTNALYEFRVEAGSYEQADPNAMLWKGPESV